MKPNQHNDSIRKIFLPGGKSVEVVRVSETDERVREGLHVCPDCGCELVQPTSWAETADERWEIKLRCPNCWWTTEGVFDRRQLLALEEQLDDGIDEMIRDLQLMAEANMTEQIERFVAALNADLILPEDF